jgi:hypothetical protein
MNKGWVVQCDTPMEVYDHPWLRPDLERAS